MQQGKTYQDDTTVCTPGFQKTNTGCEKCPDQQTSSGGVDATCYCAPGTSGSAGSCAECFGEEISSGNGDACSGCSGDKKYSSPTRSTCLSQDECNAITNAIANSSFFGQSTCNCPDGTALSFKGDACVDKTQCGGNTTTMKTGTYTGAYGPVDILTCICDNGYVLNPVKLGCILLGDCNSTSNMKLTDDYKCECADDATLEQNSDTFTCQKNTPDPVICTTSQYFDGTSCQNCPAGTSSKGNQDTTCDCGDGKYFTNGQCIEIDCQNNQFWNVTNQQCTDCPENSTGGNVTVCTCNEGYKPLDDKNTCMPLNCETNQKISGNQCIDCPNNSYSAGGQSTVCTCDDGYKYNDQSQCVLDGCEKNQYMNSSICVSCPENSTSEGGRSTVCTCDKGLQFDANQGICLSNNANTASPLVSVLLVALVVVLCTMAVTLLLALRKRRNSLSMAASVPFSIAGAL